MDAIQMNQTFRWYADAPFAFTLKRESQKRITTIMVIVAIVLSMLFGVYFVIKMNQPEIKIEERQKISIDIKSIPPPPSEVRKQEKPVAVVGSSQVVSRGEATAIAASTEKELSAALESATSSLLSDLAAGLPSATGGGIGGGIGGGSLSGIGSGDLLGNTGGGGGLGSAGLGSVDVGGVIGGLGGVSSGGSISGPGALKGGIGLQKGGLGVKGKSNLAVGLNYANLKVSGGGRSADDIAKIVAKSKDAIQKCYEEARSIDGSFEGEAIMIVFILPNGLVKDAQIGRVSFKSDVMQRCIMKIFKRMQFTTVSQASIQRVQIPYEFKMGG